jgi:hypothetical protein
MALFRAKDFLECKISFWTNKSHTFRLILQNLILAEICCELAFRFMISEWTALRAVHSEIMNRNASSQQIAAKIKFCKISLKV